MMSYSIELYVFDGGGVHFHLRMASLDDLRKSAAFLDATTRDGNFSRTDEPYYVVTKAQLEELSRARKAWNRGSNI